MRVCWHLPPVTVNLPWSSKRQRQARDSDNDEIGESAHVFEVLVACPGD